MFKINFLVLFFSTVGELNLSNTVNLKFIRLINSGDDILRLDWCTYIVECLVKTKRSWKRNGFYNGPMILILVLYAHSEIPIKLWSIEMLNKLESDMFPEDDDCDTDVGEEAEHEVSDGEQVWEEDDVDEDYYSMGVPTELEAMEKYVSTLLKKAGELVERADEVLE